MARRLGNVCHHPSVLRRRGFSWFTAFALLLCLLGAGAGARPARAAEPLVLAGVSSAATGRAMPPGFLGFSFEYRAMHIYTGRDPHAINPVLLSLIRQLNPRQAPVLRIGGNSADVTWWPMPGVIPPDGISYSLTSGFLRTARALTTALRGRMIMDVNLEADRPALAAQESRAIVSGLGRQNLAALELGNEPDLYSSFTWYTDRLGHAFAGRPPDYTFGGYLVDYAHWRAVVPRGVALAGPAFAESTWMDNLPTFLAFEPGVRFVTFHRYPLRGCVNDPTSVVFPSVSNLLADSSSIGLAGSVANYVLQTHARHDRFRLDELNSAACTGRSGVSDTFTSALWALDTLFNLAKVGVDGINLHTLPGSAYEPFVFRLRGGVWTGNVRPVYYGMLMFERAFPPGARLLQVTEPTGPLKVWATVAPNGQQHVVLINKDPSNATLVRLRLPESTPVSETTLSAPDVSSTTGVTIAGRSFPPNTRTGQLSGTVRTQTVNSSLGGYTISVPPATAILLTP